MSLIRCMQLRLRVGAGALAMLTGAVVAQGQANVAPKLSLTANGSIIAQAYQGSPLLLSATAYHPTRFSTKTILTPLVINAQNGSWANTVQLALIDGTGTPQNWPIQLIAPPAGSLTLDQTTVGKLTWVVAPSATSAIAPGTYTAIATLDTTASAGNTGWNGITISYTVSIQISPLPSPLTADQQEEQATLLATYDHLLGNNTQAIADLDSFLTQNPNAIGALSLKGNFLEQMGQTADGLGAYDTAVAAFYAADPNPSEAPEVLLIPQGRLRSALLSQTGQRGTPQAAIRVVNQGVQSAGVYFLDLQVTNVGNDAAEDITLNTLAFQTQSGAGQIVFNNVISPRLPISAGFLAVNGSATLRIFVSGQGTVSDFSLTETGTTVDIFGTPSPFSETQTISGNFTGGGGGGTPTPLTITAINETQPYGGATPNLNNVTYSGFVNGDGPGSLSGLLGCTTTATQSSPAGSYPILCSGLSSANYTITFVPGTLSITPVSLTVSASDASRQYGHANPAFTASYSGFVNGDGPSALTGTLSCSTTATASSPVSGGPYLIVCSGLNSNNYTIGYLPGTLTISPAPLTITADNQSRPYGQPNPALTASFSGFANGDTPASLTGALNCTTTATAASPAGSYSISCSGLSSTNYTISNVPGQLTVTGTSLTITGSNASRPYGQANPAFTASFTGFVNGDDASVLTGVLNCTTTATTGSPAGNYPINCSGLSSTTYTIAYIPGQLTITPAPLGITANNASRRYGQANPAFTAGFTGFVNGETISALTGALSCASAATISSPVAGSPFAINCSGLSSTNYTISYIPGQLTVTPAPLSITANNASRQYGQANPAFTAGFTGFVNGETISALTGALSCASAATTSSPVAGSPFAINCSGLSSTNYTISYIPGQLTVTPAPLSITANNASRQFGQPNPVFTVSFTGFVNGEAVSVLTGTLNCTTTATLSSPVGNYPINCSGLSSTNYSITYNSGQLTVTSPACAAGVGNSVSVTRSGFSYNVLTKRYAQTVTLKNLGGTAITGPVYLVLDSLANATLYSGSGSTTCSTPLGSPYISIAGALNAGASANVVLQFTDPANAAINYTTRILSGAGQP